MGTVNCSFDTSRECVGSYKERIYNEQRYRAILHIMWV